MAVQDKWVTLGAYFKVKPSKLEAFEKLADQFVEATSRESGMRFYGWSFEGDEAHCRQGYLDAEGLLEHAANVAHLFQAALQIADCTKMGIHGPEEELAKLRGPVKGFKEEMMKIRGPVAVFEEPQFFVMRNSFRQ